MNEEIKKTAIDAALLGGKILKEGFGTSFKISSKEGKNNLVTEYDNKSEDAIINLIKSRFPAHRFWAEESGISRPDDGEITWVIDPLDGTVNFAHNLPIFSVSIAAVKGKDILCGVIYHPILDELFVAVKGHGATLNGKPINPSATDDMSTSFLVTGFPYNVHENPGHCIDHFVGIIRSGIPIRRLGSAALDLAYVACGRFDGFWEINLHPWDVAAGVLLVREAGGLVTQYNGNDYWISDSNMLASNGKVHNQIIETLQSCYIEFTENNGN
jgi:myo-inositol-1(or 4)-monophosphatase